jgi:glycosyltransferase involved in cell wall biosynthesis
MRSYANEQATLVDLRISVLVPVYNDWRSFTILLKNLDSALTAMNYSVRVMAINDGSILVPPAHFGYFSPAISRLELVYLVRNLGHQRAIAIGLAALEDDADSDVVIVMDADGEDPPESIVSLLNTHLREPQQIIVATRRKRREGLLFRIFYQLYKQVFSLLTGVSINFGNFCLIPSAALSHLVYDSNLWNHLAAAVNRSNYPLCKIELDRGQRYAGHSQMDFQSLLLHGFSAISVYVDIIALRTLVASIAIGFLSFLGILIVLGIMVFTNLAIPGWATSAVGLLLVIIFQTLFFSAGAVIIILNQRSNALFIPAQDTKKLIRKREIRYDGKL